MSIGAGISAGKNEGQDAKLLEYSNRIGDLEQKLEGLASMVTELKVANSTIAMLNSKVGELEIAVGLSNPGSVASNVDKLESLLADYGGRCKPKYRITNLFK